MSEEEQAPRFLCRDCRNKEHERAQARALCIAEIQRLLRSPLSPEQVEQALINLTGITDGYVADLNVYDVLLDGTFDVETLELIVQLMRACERSRGQGPSR